MFARLGRIVTRAPLVVVAVWLILTNVVKWTAPDWESVAQEGEFAFLPEDSASREAERLYRRAFPAPAPAAEGDDAQANVQQDPLGSNIVIVVRREDRAEGLTQQDKDFIEDRLRPELERLQQTTPAGRWWHEHPDAQLPRSERIIKGIWTWQHDRIGQLLVSEDKQSTVVVMELTTEFLDRNNGLVVARVEDLVERIRNDRQAFPDFPPNLDLAISGSATVGIDMLRAERESTKNTELFTKLLVIVLLLAIYRAPLLMLIPLITVGMAVETTTHALRHMAAAGWIGLFSGLEIYVTVVVYGTGVDFCLFLIARYKEELDAGASYEDAIATALGRVGIALATSAGTSIAGIAMMMFAEFGKFPQAGFGISFGLFIVLCCCVTFTPALLRLTGRWAFWPAMRKERLSAREGWIPKSSFWTTLVQGERWPARFWEWTARVIDHRPGTVFLATVALMLPFIVVAVLNYRLLSYGLLSELRPTVTSVIGANAVREHFPAGMTGMTTILLRNDDFDLADNLREGERLSQRITDELERRKEELKIVDVRSQNDPLGKSTVAREYEAPLRRNIPKWNVRRTMAQRNYASLQGPEAGQVMKIDLVLSIDPFSRESISTLGQTEQAVREALQSITREAAAAEDAHDADTDGDPGATRQQRLLSTLAAETQIVTLGSTASIRDLKTVTDRDRVRIAVLVTSAVFLVLLVLLGRPMISAYLVATVVFSFLVTLGVTHAVFWLLEPGAYAGLDWKVPVFVFTILVAIGEDYNVFLMTRVAEEQLKHGPKRGVLVALTKTGGIISSCGIIMAGTFLSLMTGTLTGIIQLGFALSFGVLLDTFVVRPILVPTYLVLLYDGRLGRLGELLGASQVPVVRLWAGHSSGTSAVPPPPHAEGLREVSETYRS